MLSACARSNVCLWCHTASMTLLERDPSPPDVAGVYTGKPYTSNVAMTTIRVESEVRDRLAARAYAHGRTLGAELSAMLDDLMWQGIEDGYRRLAANEAEFG